MIMKKGTAQREYVSTAVKRDTPAWTVTGAFQIRIYPITETQKKPHGQRKKTTKWKQTRQPTQHPWLNTLL
jgi:hypothetical protein